MKEKVFIISLLSGKGSINFNKTIANKFGIYAAILLGELCYKYDYWLERDQVTEDEYFYCTQEDIESDTCLTAYMQREALKSLGDIVLVKKVGMPAKNYYKIDLDKLINTITENTKHSSKRLKSSTTRDEKSSQHGVKDFNTTNKTNTNKLNTNNICVDEYTKQKELDNIITDIISHFNSICSTKFKCNTAATKKLIKRHLSEGFVPDDFKKVIDLKYQDWGETPVKFKNGQMSNEFLRPSTLFGDKFESYVYEALARETSEGLYTSESNDVDTDVSDLVF